MGSIPGRGMYGRQPVTVSHIDVCLSLALSPFSLSKINKHALAGVAQWIEHGPVNQSVAGLIPSQGTGLGCRPRPQWGTHKR